MWKSPRSIQPIFCGVSAGQPHLGVSRGPAQLWSIQQRRSGISQSRNCLPPLLVSLLKDAASCRIGGLKDPERVIPACMSLQGLVSEAILSGHTALTLGGDHSLGLGSVRGSLSAEPSTLVVWVDAHADINTAQTTTTGNMHGCPLGFIVDGVAPAITQTGPASSADSDHAAVSSDSSLRDWLYKGPRLSPSNLVYIGLRSIDPPELDILHHLGILYFTSDDVRRMTTRGIINWICKAKDVSATTPIHVSFDIDVLDPSVAPSTGTPVLGGLTLTEGAQIVTGLREAGNLIAIDLVEVNPQIGTKEDAEKTLFAGEAIIKAAVGW